MKDPRIRFRRGTPFERALRERVDHFFKETGRDQRGGTRFATKTAIHVIAWIIGYAAFLLYGGNLWACLGIGIFMGLVCGGFGFNIMHDGNHGASSRNGRLNRLYGLGLDFVGGSSYIWRQKHNVMHHTYPNVVGTDDDLEAGAFARFAPEQDWHPIHQMQHLYMWPLYGFISLKWHLFDDFIQLWTGKINGIPFTRPKGKDLAVLLGMRVLFVTWTFVIPSSVHGWGPTLLFWFLIHFTLGIVLAIVFQLAHCVEEAEFFEPIEGEVQRFGFVEYQLRSTVDFARKNKIANWYMGGLNFQAVHHIFPRISHVHYADLAPILEQTCAEFGVKYRSIDTLQAAIASHHRWLRRMGTRPVKEVAVVGTA